MTPPPALSPSLEEIAALLEERAREFRTMHDDVPAFAGEIAVWSAAASTLRSLAEVLVGKDAEIERLREALGGMPVRIWRGATVPPEEYASACVAFVGELRRAGLGGKGHE